MPTELLIALIGGVGTLIGAGITYATQRSKVRIDSISAQAAADLARAQATDIGFENLVALYHEVKKSNDELRAEVAELRATITTFEATIRQLPTEYQAMFARKGTRPKASGPTGESGA